MQRERNLGPQTDRPKPQAPDTASENDAADESAADIEGLDVFRRWLIPRILKKHLRPRRSTHARRTRGANPPPPRSASRQIHAAHRRRRGRPHPAQAHRAAEQDERPVVRAPRPLRARKPRPVATENAARAMLSPSRGAPSPSRVSLRCRYDIVYVENIVRRIAIMPDPHDWDPSRPRGEAARLLYVDDIERLQSTA